MSSPFNALPEPKVDPIFAASQRAKAAGPGAIDGTVGMLLDDAGNPTVLPSVRRAMQELTAQEPDVGYCPIRGRDAFRESVGRLIGADAQTASVATTGGTGAMSANAHLLANMMADPWLVVPTPTWANHANVFRAAGVGLQEVPYLDEAGAPTLTHILRSVRFGTNAVLLHGTCHNPTGLDFSQEQWETLAQEMAKHGTVAMLDIAYQGLGDEPEHDALPMKTLRSHGVPTLVGWSGAKNHTLYAERPGLAAAMTSTPAEQRKVQGQYNASLRATQSSSPGYAQRLISLVQDEHADTWRTDLRSVRMLIAEKRRVLTGLLPEEFTAPLAGKGMFSTLPLSPEQTKRLEQENVFILEDGRINIAGIPLARMEELAEKIRLARG